MTRVLVYGAVDLNLIDGSSVWLASLAEVLSGSERLCVDVLQRVAVRRDLVIRGAALRPNVTFLDPWQLAPGDVDIAGVLTRHRERRLGADAAAELIELLDRRRGYGAFVIRSLDTAARLCGDRTIRGRLWAYITDPQRHTSVEERRKLAFVAERARGLLCQTPEAAAAFADLLGPSSSAQVALLPPMIPAVSVERSRTLDPDAPRLAYAGKFSPPYLILEMLDAFETIRERAPAAEFHVLGDKFHNDPPVEGFVERVTDRLRSTPGVVWHGGVDRMRTAEILATVDVATSWRDPCFDDSLELSTKVLEYAGQGIPVLMNPTAIQTRIFGPDYPAYVTSEDEFVGRFLAITRSPELHAALSARVREATLPFTFASVLAELEPLLVSPAVEPAVVLLAGDDLEGLGPLVDQLVRDPGLQVLTKVGSSRGPGDPPAGGAPLADARVIFCASGSGPAEWYSHHMRADQRLVVRLPSEDLLVPRLDRVEWSNVDRIVFTRPEDRAHFLAARPGLRVRAALIPDAVDGQALGLEKLPGAEFNLGFMATSPRASAAGLALEILEQLRARDRRYTLFFRGLQPWNHPATWQDPDQRADFDAFFSAIANLEYADAVVFDPADGDLATWLSKVGFLLSTGDSVGSGAGLAEAMASGAIPVIRTREAARELYPERYFFAGAAEAADLIGGWRTCGRYAAESAAARRFALEHFDQKEIVARYRQLISQLLAADSAALSPDPEYASAVA